MAKQRKKIITLLKIAVSAFLVYFIFTKVDLGAIAEILKKTAPLPLVFSVLLFLLSKIISAVRLNLYFHRLKVFLDQISNLKLYLLGMFYNLFLPGGIGGDAYKGYVLKKKFDVKTKKMVSAIVLDRLSGLHWLFIYACILAMALENETLKPFRLVFLFAIFVSILVFWGMHKRFFTDMVAIFWQSFALSALVQLAQLGSAFFILKALNIEADTIAYLFIFLVSSIVAVLPLTIGGIGSREVTFYYGATLLALDQNTSVSISMLFFLITALVSLFGVYYHFFKIKLTTLHTK
ncbi:MAG: lysylphosphatidylglycerol synthase transmembrane domain-containing protein [Flavobacteriaceae bacterium]